MKAPWLAMMMLLIATIVSTCTSTVIAQGIQFGINGEAAIPMGDFGDVAGIGYGGSISGEQKLDENIAVTVIIGYLVWPGEETEEPVYDTMTKTDFTAIPIQVGLKYYLGHAGGFRMYGMAEVGVHAIKTEVTVEGDYYTPINTGSYETRYSIAPAIGAEIPLGSVTLDLGARYQYVAEADAGNLRYFGVRLGLKFGGGA